MRRHIKVDRLEVRASGVSPDTIAAALRGLGPALQERLSGGLPEDDQVSPESPLRVSRDPQPAALAAGLAAHVARAIGRASASVHGREERP